MTAFDRYRPECRALAQSVLDGTSFDTEINVTRLGQNLLDCLEAECEDLEREKSEQADAAYGDHIDREIDRLREGDL